MKTMQKDPICENPHIVETMNFTVNGTEVEVRFADNCYRVISQEELERRVRKFQEACQKSWQRQQLDKLLAQKKAEAG